MAGLRERQKKEREARILRAATRSFETRGYSGTSIRDIARQADLAVGTIYNYFRSKPEIVLAIVRRDTAAVFSAGEAILKVPLPDPAAAVKALMEQSLEPFVHSDRALWRELVAAALVDPEIGAGFFAQDLRLIGQLTRLLVEFESRGELRPGVEPGQGAIVLYAVFFSWFMASLTSEDIDFETVRGQIGQGIDLVLKGLLAPERQGEIR